MTATTMRTPTFLRAVFLVHGLITLAGAAVLTVAPAAIPSAVGITLERGDYLLVYLVGAAELAVAVLSFGAARLTDPQALGLVITTLVVLHLTSGILDLVYMAMTEVNGTMIANTVLRFTVVVVLITVWHYARPHQTPGTNR
jgi:predicted small integral membrane protein